MNILKINIFITNVMGLDNAVSTIFLFVINDLSFITP